MPNQIVPLSSFTNSADSSFSYSGVFWLSVPSANVVPNPNASSQVRFIDQLTLAALRAGTLVEQPFTTILFPSGTTQATAQTAMAAQYTTAQGIVTAAASPLSGVIGTEFTGSAWVTVPTSAVFDPNNKLVADVGWAAAAGLIPGITSGRATGYCATSATTLKPVLATTYTPQGTNAQRSLVSTSANDAAAGTGAQQVTVTYLDAAFALHTEVVTLNGTTPVNTVGANWAYLESMVVTQAGTSGGANAGVISVMTGTAGTGTAWGSIAAPAGVGDNQTFWAHHYVPTGVTCYVLSFEGASSAVMQTLILTRSGLPSATNLPLIQIGPTLLTPTAGDYREHDFTCALAVTGPDLIQCVARPFAATASTILAGLEWIQF